MVPEAPMEDAPTGKKPAGEGWFIVNAREGEWLHNEKFGEGVVFEGSAQFPHYGINIQVMMPGQPNCYYHAEEGQEDFLVLSGECLVLIEGEERKLKAWDFVHCPPWTEHVFVGAGDGPCAILMVGSRGRGEGVIYPVSEVALRYGASVQETTSDPQEAYAGHGELRRGPALPDVLP
jgi:uncharacterized cupin superfamily protein